MLDAHQGEIELGKTFVVDGTDSIDIDAVPLNGRILLKVIVVAPNPFLKALIVSAGEEAKIAMDGHRNPQPPFVLGQASPAYQNYIVKPDLLSSYLTVLNNHANMPWYRSAYLKVAGLACRTAYMGWKAHVKARPVRGLLQLAKLEALRGIASSGSQHRVALIKEIGGVIWNS
ncbi:hypothetical protein NMY22_g5875 [Coprinellus aureogranulatus]|nr:hypothetical protein NMY22_g5875 [Coprinellus aureogranulatus]